MKKKKKSTDLLNMLKMLKKSMTTTKELTSPTPKVLPNLLIFQKKNSKPSILDSNKLNTNQKEVFEGKEVRKSSVDWTTVSPAVINPIKDQGQCGSCWAFSTIGSSESAIAIATGDLGSFSE